MATTTDEQAVVVPPAENSLACECVHIAPLGGLWAPGTYPPDGVFGGGPPGQALPPPDIIGVLPTSGPVGTYITVTGSGMVDGVVVLQDSVALATQFFSATIVGAFTVGPTGQYTIKVRNPDGQESPTGFVHNVTP